MKLQDYLKLVGFIFGLIAVMHVLRLVLGWEVVLGSWDVPLWLSLVAAVVASYLAYQAFRLAE